MVTTKINARGWCSQNEIIKPRTHLSKDRYQWAKECMALLLPSAPSSVVSDLGAGIGKLRSQIEDLRGTWQPFDLSPHRPEIIKWDLDMPAPPNCKQPGIVLLLDVIEHLYNPGIALRNISSHALTNSYLIVTTPNPHWSKNRFFFLKTGCLTHFKQSDLESNHHVFTGWAHIIAHLLKENGFIIKECVTLNDIPEDSVKHEYSFIIRFIFRLAGKFIEYIDPSARGSAYGVIATKCK